MYKNFNTLQDAIEEIKSWITVNDWKRPRIEMDFSHELFHFYLTRNLKREINVNSFIFTYKEELEPEISIDSYVRVNGVFVGNHA